MWLVAGVGEDVEEDKLAVLDAGWRLIHHHHLTTKVDMIVDGDIIGGRAIDGNTVDGYQGVREAPAGGNSWMTTPTTEESGAIAGATR